MINFRYKVAKMPREIFIKNILIIFVSFFLNRGSLMYFNVNLEFISIWNLQCLWNRMPIVELLDVLFEMCFWVGTSTLCAIMSTTKTLDIYFFHKFSWPFHCIIFIFSWKIFWKLVDIWGMFCIWHSHICLLYILRVYMFGTTFHISPHFLWGVCVRVLIIT